MSLIAYETTNLTSLLNIFCNKEILETLIDYKISESNTTIIRYALLHYFGFSSKFFTERSISPFLILSDCVPVGIILFKKQDKSSAKVDIAIINNREWDNFRERLNLCKEIVNTYCNKYNVNTIIGRIHKGNRASKLFAYWGGFKMQSNDGDYTVVSKNVK